MTTRFHIDNYTIAQQTQLDAAFASWLAAEAINEHHGYELESAYDKAKSLRERYEALKAEFDEANAAPSVRKRISLALEPLLSAIEVQNQHALDCAELDDYYNSLPVEAGW